MNKNNYEFELLRKISKRSDISQRELSKQLGFSLGKLNHLLKELRKKGLVKIMNFKKNKKKINYLYVLTPQGISLKTKLAISFMKKKMKEYDELKSEIEAETSKQNIIGKNKLEINSKIKKIDYDLL